VPESRTAKAVFAVAETGDGDGGSQEVLVFAVVRGDMEVNETKLANAVAARSLRPAEPAEIRGIGAEPGYGSPVGIERDGVLVVVDDLVAASPNLVGGANREDYHYRNLCCGRDYEPDLAADIVAARSGDACPMCAAPLRTERGVEVGNIFKLGTKYSESMGATYLDKDGRSRAMTMGCYGIGTGRLIASVIEQSHDDAGIVWPVAIAPYELSLVALQHPKSPHVRQLADELYAELSAAGVEVLLDDRDERPGVKFNDADLIGVPLRVTVGSRGLENGLVELTDRATGERADVPVEETVAEVRERLRRMRSAVDETLVEETMHGSDGARPQA
jgi:prolyl-tRNA synthetase